MNRKVTRGGIRRRAILSASVIALAAIPAAALAVPANPPCENDEDSVCRIVVTDTISSIYTEQATHIVNSGRISNGIRRGTSDFLSIVNLAGGVIEDLDARIPGGAGSGGSGELIVNAGAILTDVLLSDGLSIFVNDGGSVNGEVRKGNPNGGGSLIYVQRTYNAGMGGVYASGSEDIYVRSFKDGGQTVVDAPPPPGFEILGVEVLGRFGSLSLISADPDQPAPGMVLMGDGRIINQGNIGVIPGSVSNFPGGFALLYLGHLGTVSDLADNGPVIDMDVGLASFRNEGTIGGNIGIAARTFSNSGTINGDSYVSSSTFANSGTINGDSMVATDGFTNDGTINGDSYVEAASFTNNGLMRSTNADAEAAVTVVASRNRDFSFVNDGDIFADVDTTGASASNAMNFPLAVRIYDDARQPDGRNSRVQNSGSIVGGIEIDALSETFTFTNSGEISSPSIDNVSASEAVFVKVGDNGMGQVANAASATIINSGDILGGATFFISADETRFVNSGTIHAAEDEDRALALRAFHATDEDGSLTSLDFTNEGEIGGTVYIESAALVSNIVNRGTVSGTFAMGDGDFNFTNIGSIHGDLVFGEGNNRIDLRAGSSVRGTIRAGTGQNTIGLNLSGTADAPDLLDFASFTGFNALVVEAGVGRIDGSVGFDSFTINGGRLIGGADSTLTGTIFNVGALGAFGSAGTVNGNVHVAGTLSPGASPGTMTINGDLSLASGSNTLFEMSPTISDAIVINGALTIASGSKLTLTGERPLTPGLAYDLITATGGITGQFSTIDKATSVLGYIRHSADRIQLLGQFALHDGAKQQVRTVVDYMNDLLIDGTATAGILDAVPSLLAADGFANEAAMSRLSSEPYASAMQIGVEKGLALAGAARAMQMGHGDQPGLFTFGQMFGDWRRLPGNDDTGVSRANVSTQGVLGGIGFGSQKASVGAFIGYGDARQNINALGAKTDADGVIAGVIGKAELGGFDASALIAWDGGKADTRRELNASTTAASSYKLRGWTFDAAIGYTAPIGNGWTLRPTLGVTHIATNRGGAQESGAAHFDLIVDGKKQDATLLNGAITVKGSAEAKLQPWASLGVRHQLAGDLTSVSARFVGAPTSYTLPGVARDRTLATVEAGLNAKVTNGVALFVNVNGEFGADTNAKGGRIGGRVSF